MMTPEQLERMAIRLAAQDLLLGSLFSLYATNLSSEPRASVFRIIEGLVASVHAAETPVDGRELKYLHDIEDELRRFEKQVDTRLAGLGHGE